MKKFQLISLVLISGLLFAGFAESNKPAYLIYSKNGNVVSYQSILVQSKNSDLTFFGELHNNAIAHWLQLELLMDLQKDTTAATSVGFEMFEADQQILVDEYLNANISQSSFESEARLWNNYSTDYKPVLEFARENNLNVVATNIPRRYASSVYRNGLEALDNLTDEAKQWMMPLPVEVDTELPGYQNMLDMAQGHGGMNLVYSQAVKDATMSHFILKNLDENGRMLHLNGSYHSNNYEGIVWYVKRDRPELRVLTINTVVVDDVHDVESEMLEAADFTIVVPATMTTTY
ncbi:ChaN family lipoprotein [Rhodohalobacter halophilus]|uniref:ChaN family lipoprotein n=1 Tax=Rhodohalobacter halophilus TaxID=1812810 RepID=UPI00083FC4CC|nr:ChaN family lipoprotein [Rhodohalobacter halophilus]